MNYSSHRRDPKDRMQFPILPVVAANYLLSVITPEGVTEAAVLQAAKKHFNPTNMAIEVQDGIPIADG